TRRAGSDKTVRKNNKIYSGLGLLLSPTSSMGNDSEHIRGSSIKSPACMLRKNKSRLTGSNSSQVETSHSSMDGREKRKRLSEANQQLLEKNAVNKPIDVGRNAATVNGSVSSSLLKAPNLDKVSPTVGRTISRKAHAKSSIRPKVPRKLLAREDNMQSRDIDASQSSVSELAFDLAWPRKNYCDVSEDETTQAVRKMNFKISSQNHVTGDTYHANSNANSKTLPNGWKKNKSRLTCSNSSQVETSHSSMDGREKRKRKDLESKRIQFRATSSSSKVSGSFRRASLQEVKASPVGSVSSSLLNTPNLDKVSPAAGRTISRKAHAKSSIRPKVPRKLLAREDNMQSRDIDASQS
nr:cullin, conserved site-containing protein [Tanacetum cinerariifolium]